MTVIAHINFKNGFLNADWVQSRLQLLQYIEFNLNWIFFVFSQVNRIKIPKQLDELVEMESETGNAVTKFFFRIKAEIRGVSIYIYVS